MEERQCGLGVNVLRVGLAVLLAVVPSVVLGERCNFQDGVSIGWTQTGFSDYDYYYDKEDMTNDDTERQPDQPAHLGNQGPTGFRQCPWGCCWHLQEVCCLSPQGTNLAVVIAVPIALVIFAVLACAITCVASRWWIRNKAIRAKALRQTALPLRNPTTEKPTEKGHQNQPTSNKERQQRPPASSHTVDEKSPERQPRRPRFREEEGDE